MNRVKIRQAIGAVVALVILFVAFCMLSGMMGWNIPGVNTIAQMMGF